MNYRIFILTGLFVLAHGALAKDKHEHGKHKENPSPENTTSAKDHGEHEEDEHAHDEGNAHAEKGHEEEAGSQVGPDKGILSASPSEGISLSPEAIKNFEIKTQALNGTGPWRIPSSAIMNSGEEVNIYRVRGGHYKRIDFRVSGKDENGILISSRELRANDEIVIDGIGFLRIAELTAFGGAPEGHSH